VLIAIISIMIVARIVPVITITGTDRDHTAN